MKGRATSAYVATAEVWDSEQYACRTRGGSGPFNDWGIVWVGLGVAVQGQILSEV